MKISLRLQPSARCLSSGSTAVRAARFRLPLACMGALSLIGAGCGLKGPLYLPDKDKETVAAPSVTGATTQPTPASESPEQKRDRSAPQAATNAASQPVSPPDPDRPASTPPVP